MGQPRRGRQATLAVLVTLTLAAAAYVAVITIHGDRDHTDAGHSKYAVTMGSPSAPDSVVIYEDFLSPESGELEAKTHNELEALAAQGKVYVDYRPYDVLSPDYSERAANAFFAILETSGQTVAKEFHDLIYENQPISTGPYPNDQWLVDKAVDSGAKESTVEDAIKQNTYAGMVTAATDAARAASVTGTPTVMLNGKVFANGGNVDDIARSLLDALK